MRIKTFEFPSFEEWNKTQEYSQKIGDYTCAVEAVVSGCDGDTENFYQAAIANYDYPTNILVKKIFAKGISCDRSDEKAIKEWYEVATAELNDAWKAFVLKKYLCMEKEETAV